MAAANSTNKIAAADLLTGTTLASNVVTSSLTSLGALVGLNANFLNVQEVLATSDSGKSVIGIQWQSQGFGETIAYRDENGISGFKNVSLQMDNITSAAGTTTLTSAAGYYQHLNGTTTQTIKLPDATTIGLGEAFLTINSSTGLLTLNDNNGASIANLSQGMANLSISNGNSTAGGAWISIKLNDVSALKGTTLPSNITASSLTSVGTLGSLTVTGNITNSALTISQLVATDASKNLISIAYASSNTNSAVVQRDGSGNFSAGTITAALSGNASTATTLQTGRTIGGVSFNGSANIVPQTIQMVDDSSDATGFILFGNASGTVSQQPKTNTVLTFDATAGQLAATSFSGALYSASLRDSNSTLAFDVDNRSLLGTSGGSPFTWNDSQAIFTGDIVGDFSNATLSSRVYFQDSGTNSTSVSAVPGPGTTLSEFVCFNTDDPDNAGFATFTADGADINIGSDASGTGTAPTAINFQFAGSTVASINGGGTLTLPGDVSNPFINLLAATNYINVQGSGAFYVTSTRFAAIGTKYTDGWSYVDAGEYKVSGSQIAASNLANGTIGSGKILLAKSSISPQTGGSGSPYSITTDDSGTVFTNEGATGEAYLNLPSAAAGLTYTFCVQDADGLRIVADTGDTIRLSSTVSASAGYAESTTIGSTVTLTAINSTEWIGMSINGTWSVT